MGGIKKRQVASTMWSGGLLTFDGTLLAVTSHECGAGGISKRPNFEEIGGRSEG